MAMRILWPNIAADYIPVARDAVGQGFETDFYSSAAEVTDEQWANADAIVGQCPQSYKEVSDGLGLSRDSISLERAGRALTLCDAHREAAALVSELQRRFPEATLTNRVSLPVIAAIGATRRAELR